TASRQNSTEPRRNRSGGAHAFGTRTGGETVRAGRAADDDEDQWPDQPEGLLTPALRSALFRRNVGRNGVGHLAGALGATEDELRGLGLVRVAVGAAHNDLARTQLVEEDPLRQRVLDLALDGPAQRPSTHPRVPALLREPLLGVRGELQPHVLVAE